VARSVGGIPTPSDFAVFAFGRQVSRFDALEDLRRHNAGFTVKLVEVGTVRRQTASARKIGEQ